MIVREARCACGALTVRAEGDPARISLCHCNDCKRRTGSAFAWNATYPAERVRVSGAWLTFERSSDDGHWARNHFCGGCGATLFYEIEIRPGMITIPAGAFADRAFPAPTVEVYDARRCPWLPDFGIPRES
ncbi:MAG TPA: GFA family protein [Allosphingosinicella sp.]|nr:GFA family protein [Allosphingosinicella sp.]